MSYTTEETAIICGFLNLYFERDSVDAAVREKFRRFRRRAEQDALDREDYRWAEKALIFYRISQTREAGVPGSHLLLYFARKHA